MACADLPILFWQVRLESNDGRGYKVASFHGLSDDGGKKSSIRKPFAG